MVRKLKSEDDILTTIGKKVVQVGMDGNVVGLLSGWCCAGGGVAECRQLSRHSTHRRSTVLYIAPCGRRLRSDSDVDQYLVTTDSQLTIDLFCFDPDLRVDIQFISKQVRTDTGAANRT